MCKILNTQSFCLSFFKPTVELNISFKCIIITTNTVIIVWLWSGVCVCMSVGIQMPQHTSEGHRTCFSVLGFWFILDLFLWSVYECLLTCIYVHHVHACLVSAETTRTHLIPLELELQVVVNCVYMLGTKALQKEQKVLSTICPVSSFYPIKEYLSCFSYYTMLYNLDQ